MTRQIPKSVLMLMACTWAATVAIAQDDRSPVDTGTIIGTVLDVNGNTVPKASVLLQGNAPDDRRAVVTHDNGFFKLDNLNPGTPYRVIISAQGFASWTSNDVMLRPGQFFMLPGITLRVATAQVTVNVVPSEQLALEQLQAEEKQRILGFIPNFYVVYDRNAVALSSKQKFHLAFKALIDPATFAGFGLNAGLDHLAEYPNYELGAEGYMQRVGATFIGGYTTILVGDAALPSLLHQDPRYFYQGRGTKMSRLLHALSSPLFTRGDNGRRQVNFSDIGGDLVSGALANAYYPAKDRGPGLMLNSVVTGAAMRMVDSVMQEFVLHKITSRHSKNGGSSDHVDGQ
jgi:Carboxypeptidase regulatory-like domain